VAVLSTGRLFGDLALTRGDVQSFATLVASGKKRGARNEPKDEDEADEPVGKSIGTRSSSKDSFEGVRGPNGIGSRTTSKNSNDGFEG